MKNVYVAMTMAERAQDEAGRALDAADDYLTETVDQFGIGSEQHTEALRFQQAAAALLNTTKKAVVVLAKAQPTF